MPSFGHYGICVLWVPALLLCLAIGPTRINLVIEGGFLNYLQAWLGHVVFLLCAWPW